MNEKGLTGSTLKWIAIVTMLIDHTGAAVLEKMLISGKYGEVSAANPLYQTDMVLRKTGIPHFLFPFGGRLFTYEKCVEICRQTGAFCFGFGNTV